MGICTLCFCLSAVFDVPHVIWIDNYSHILRVNMPTADSNWWRNSLWTAKAAITLDSLKNSSSFLKTNPSTGMPSIETLFSLRVTKKFKEYYTSREEKGVEFFANSISKDVQSVPIKPDTKTAKDADKDRKFTPLGILQHNIGSNSGLFKVLMEIRREEKNKPHIPALLMDCNIYWRVMKVSFSSFCPYSCSALLHICICPILTSYCFCLYISLFQLALQDDVGSTFRKATFCFLGTWHVYKMASTCVWRMAAADFIAPLFHQFFPGVPFPWTPRLVLSSRVFSLIRLSYPNFKRSLDMALAKEALTDIQRGHLLNLRSICEWFIPKVSISFLCLSSFSIPFYVFISYLG